MHTYWVLLAYIILLVEVATNCDGLSSKLRANVNNPITQKQTVQKAEVPDFVCPPGAKVFMGNLPFEVTEKDICKLLQMVQIGDAKYAKINIAMRKKTKRPLGWLLIDFKDPETAQQCVEMTNGIEFLGRTINVNIKDPPPEKRTPIQEHMIYLSNLDYSLTEIEIYNMCEDLVGPGLVVEVKIPLDKNRDLPRGFAHVEFKDPDAVNLAISQLNGVEVFERLLKAEKLSKPKLRAPASDPVPAEAEARTSELIDSL